MNIRDIYSSLSRTHKKLIFVLLDLFFLPIALWSSFALRFSELWPQVRMEPFWWMFIVIPATGVFIFSRFGLYRAVVRFMGQQAVIAVIKGVALLSLILYTLASLSGVIGFPRSIPINFAIISALYVAGTRYLVKAYYQGYIKGNSRKEAVLIYGAGEAGMQLSIAMAGSREFIPMAFIDDDATLHGQIVNGISVYSPSEVDELLQRFKVSRVVLAVPAASAHRRKQIIDMLKPLAIRVQTLPSLDELASGASSFEQLREVDLDDLLGRDVINPSKALLAGAVTGKVVLVTGAGGSIGAELCRQIALLHPKLLVMYDNSEYALYTIDSELLGNACSSTRYEVEHVAILGSVLNSSRVDKLINHYGVQTIFHAAAYKHVPMVERNVLEGVRNNIFGTRTVAECALQNGVERFILISTDKAVRPTNIMGATKRTAEQVVQSLAEKSLSTIFSMVRFGNVLGSSGSVVPLFRKQIVEGGPITLTHKDVTRYFMSIPEAAQLVIQAGTMAKGGEVFVLDMGKPVRIYDLAVNMIQLSGLTVLDERNPTGDIVIEIIGLRPGEKLFEELLVGESVEDTEHVRIMRANEVHMSAQIIDEALSDLKCAITENDPESARAILKRIVHDYNFDYNLVDLLYK
jgi:FlaA1/EpsC-like NDP-sugar epimerase